MNLQIPENIMRAVQDEFWDKFPDIKRWHKRLKSNYLKTGYVTGLSGVRRRAPIASTELINCVDTQTECLTESGWKRVNDIEVGTKIFTKNPETGDLELLPVLKLNRGQYQGAAHVMNGRLSAVTTPNHRWLVDRDIHHAKRDGRPVFASSFVTSEELPIGDQDPGRYRIHLNADRPHEQIGGNWTDDEVSLIGWLLTDGCYLKHQLQNSERIGIALVQSPRGNLENVKSIDQLIDRLSITMESQLGINKPIREYYYGGRTCKQWHIYTTLSDRIFAQLPDRVLTANFLMQLSTHQLQLLFDTMLSGCGAWNDKFGRFTQFTAGTKKKIDAFSMLCVLLGKAHSIQKRNPPKHKPKKYASMGNTAISKKAWWTVTLKQRKRAQPGFYSTWTTFDGEVWCPTTRNGTFIARRKGTIYVTGNSSIQADEAFIVCNAMTRLSQYGDPRYQANIEVHDDLTFIWKKKDLEKNTEVVVKEMLRIDPVWIGTTPLEVERSIGQDWASLKDAGKFSSTEFGHVR